MSRFRFSLVSFLFFMLLVGFFCAAMRYATDLWAGAAMSLSGTLLLLGTLAAAFRPDARQFWTGFALFGWAYFYTSIGPGYSVINVFLPTTKLLNYLSQTPIDSHSFTIDTGFAIAGNSGFAILFALFGGVAGCLIHGAAPVTPPKDQPTES